MTKLMTALARGAATGLVAGVPQVLLTQAQARLLGVSEERADIGPRFVDRVSRQTSAPLGQAEQWLLAGAFHFGYAAWWGVLYAGLQRWRPAQPHVGGPLLASLIYALAFSPWGVATRSGTERPAETRPTQESILHWTAALSFSLSLAYLFERFGEQQRSKRLNSILDSVRP